MILHKTNKLAIIVLMLSNSFIAGAQNIYDVFTNESIEILNSRYKEINSRNSIFKNKVEIRYFTIKDNEIKSVISINNQALSICMNYITNEAMSLKLMSELDQRLLVSNELEDSRNDDYGSREDCSNQVLPKLEEIKSSIISMVANKLFIKVEFEFDIKNRGEDRIDITHYYIADLKIGKISRLKNNYSNKQLKNIQNKISAKLNRNYSQANSEIKLSEIELLKSNTNYYEEDESAINESKDICSRINFQEAKFYWYAWGIIVEFQGFTNSSKIYYGRAFQLFIPYEEAKIVFENIPQFAFIKNISLPNSSINNFNINGFHKSMSLFRKPPEIEDAILLNKAEAKPKSLIVKRFQILSNAKATNLYKTEYEYDINGNILSKTLYQGGKNGFYNSTYYSYDSSALLISEISKNRSNHEISKEYSYDENNNLISIVERGSRYDGTTVRQYFYSDNSVYSISIDNSILDTRNYLRKIVLEENRIYNSERSYYVLNENNEVNGLVDRHNYNNNGQIGRDSLGRVTETYFELDRYVYYWNYDSLNRISEFLYYEGFVFKSEVEFLYKENSTFPYKRVFTRFNYSRNTVEIEEYDWTLF